MNAQDLLTVAATAVECFALALVVVGLLATPLKPPTAQSQTTVPIAPRFEPQVQLEPVSG